MREAQEKLAKQKEVIMTQDKELKVNSYFSLFFPFISVVAFLCIHLFFGKLSGEEHRGK